jgi:hypothetical protein
VGESDEPQSEKGAQAVAKYVGWQYVLFRHCAGNVADTKRSTSISIRYLVVGVRALASLYHRGQFLCAYPCDSTDEQKSKIDREDTATWFNVFNIIFELVSAYGTVGLSLGSPIANYSYVPLVLSQHGADTRFVGTWSTLSKLVCVAVMIRGRHRGLPVAIDRAVMLPRDFTAAEEQALEEDFSRRLSRMSSNLAEGDFRTHSRRGSRDTVPQRSGTVNSFSALGTGTGAGADTDRPSTPPNQKRSSISKSVTTQATHSPRALSFSLPQKPSFDRSPIMRSTMPTGTGALTPVKENMLSRNVSRADAERGEMGDKLD